jgi:hypothetical protein
MIFHRSNFARKLTLQTRSLHLGNFLKVDRHNDLVSFDLDTGTLLLSTEVRTSREDKPALGFQHIGDQYFLSQIETEEHVFTIPVTAKAAPVVAMKDQNTPSTGSNSGSN